MLYFFFAWWNHIQSYNKAIEKPPDLNIDGHVEPDNHVQQIHSGAELEVSAKY